jgi:hypothetical protein
MLRAISVRSPHCRRHRQQPPSANIATIAGWSCRLLETRDNLSCQTRFRSRITSRWQLPLMKWPEKQQSQRRADLQSRGPPCGLKQDMMSSIVRNNGNTNGSGNPRQRQSATALAATAIAAL